MRVFYIDEDEEKSKRNYYVKIDNVAVPEDLKGFKLIRASTTAELITNIMEHFGLNRNPDATVQLWSNSNFTGKRLDTLNEIPVEVEFLWVRLVLNKRE